MATTIPLPTRRELLVPKMPDEMLAFAEKYLFPDSPSSIDDNEFFRRTDSIKFIIEEYVPLARYLKSRYGNNVLGCLTGEGAQHDGEVHDQTGCIEKIQIVHGTESESEALKREQLRRGEPYLKDATYERDRSTKLPVMRSSTALPRTAAQSVAHMIITRIQKKVAKGYQQIPTLLICYTESLSTPYTQSSLVIYEQVLAWLQTKQRAELSPFSRIVLVSDKEDVKIIDLNVICPQ